MIESPLQFFTIKSIKMDARHLTNNRKLELITTSQVHWLFDVYRQLKRRSIEITLP
jgi:hypothetical protein